MTWQGLCILVVIGLSLLAWSVNLVRRDRLSVGDGLCFILCLLGALLLLSAPPLQRGLARMMEAVFPGWGWVSLALSVIAFMMIYLLTRITIVSNRVAALVRELALRQAQASAERVLRTEQPEPAPVLEKSARRATTVAGSNHSMEAHRQ